MLKDIEKLFEDLIYVSNNFINFKSLNNLEEVTIEDVRDFLEEQGYYIGIPIRGTFKYVTVVHRKTFNTSSVTSSTLIYNNSGMKDRKDALYKGVRKSLEHFNNIIKNAITI